MKKFEVTVTPNYVAKWCVADAVREILQNAIDAHKQGYAMSWGYDETAQELYINSEGASLSTQTLLLGSTTKASDSRAIGQFGEGYKIAALVLLREGLTLTIHNGPAKETWVPRFVKSRRYGCDVLTFEISSWGPFQTRGSELQFTIGGMDADMLDEIKYIWLGFSDEPAAPIAESRIGEAFERPGSVYVEDLFVCNHEPYKCSYNFRAGQLSLDRDRKLASSFDLEWLASKFWASVGDSEKIVELLEAGAADVKYVINHSSGNKLAEDAWKLFIEKYDWDAVPVETQEELEHVRKMGKTPVLLSSAYVGVLRTSSFYNYPEETEEVVPLHTRFYAWYEEQGSLRDEETLLALIEELKEFEEETR